VELEAILFLFIIIFIPILALSFLPSGATRDVGWG
jgi:hypothetical protein